MAKAVVYTVLATAFFLSVNFAVYNHHDYPKHLFLHRRFSYCRKPPAFDPLVTHIERLVEEKGISYDNFGLHLDPSTLDSVAEVADAYEYLTVGGELNTRLRLRYLFPLLDRIENDGFISFNELVTWITHQALERLDYNTQKEMIAKDRDGDFLISFKEYLPQFSDQHIEKRETGHGEAEWWQEKFYSADQDHSGLLNFTEFRDFLHPEDSRSKLVRTWLLKDRLNTLDIDNDGKLDFAEFQERAFDSYRTYAEFGTADGAVVSSPEDKFDELDKDNDKFLSVEELQPILHYLYPGELFSARYFTRYLIKEADDNGDGKLSMNEMLDHEYVFYSTVYGDNRRREYDDSHGEL